MRTWASAGEGVRRSSCPLWPAKAALKYYFLGNNSIFFVAFRQKLGSCPPGKILPSPGKSLKTPMVENHFSMSLPIELAYEVCFEFHIIFVVWWDVESLMMRILKGTESLLNKVNNFGNEYEQIWNEKPQVFKIHCCHFLST